MRTWRFPGTLGVVLAVAALTAAATGAAQPLPLLPGLNDKPTGLSIPGKFVWADLFAEDVDAAKRFYSGLLGWSWRTFGSGADEYHVAYANGRPVAGLVYRKPKVPEDARAVWIMYASAANPAGVESAVAKSGGATMVSPVNVPYRGIHAIFSDRDGALFGVLRSSTGDPADYRAEDGEWVWTHLFTRNPRAAAVFYSQLLEFEVIDYTVSEIPDDVVLASAGHARAGVGAMGADAPDDVRSAWVGFLRVADVDSSANRAEALGGQVMVRAELDTVDGQVAILTDGAGAVFGLMSLDFEGAMAPREEAE